MRVLAHPARRNRDRNPFNYLLSESLAAQGCEVVELEGGNGLFSRSDVFHIHWPQEAARGRLRSALRKIFWLVAPLVAQRLKGACIVWTVHNVRGHDQNNASLERILMRLVLSLVHGVIFLTDSSRRAACEEMPQLAAKPYAIVRHGLYGHRSYKTRGDACAAFALPLGRPVVGFLGDIKRYKGLDLLLDAFEQVPPEEATLFVAGAFVSPSYAVAIRARMKALADRGHSIVIVEERLERNALVDAIRACDVVALPYRVIWNSGLALLVLENRVPLLTSDAPAFRELESDLGSEWVRVVDGDFTGEAILASLARMPSETSARIDAFCATRSWHQIGVETVAFYRRLRALEKVAHVVQEARLD